jgi:hypothetical protein
MYFLHWLDVPLGFFFSRERVLAVGETPSGPSKAAASGTSVVVRDRGRDREEPWSNGVVGEELAGDGVLGDCVGDGATA